MKLLAVDGNSVLNRAFYGIKLLSTKEGVYTNGIYGFLNILQRVENEVTPDAVAIAFDLRAPTFRHKRYEGYKAQRKGMPEELAQQVPLLKELLTALGYRLVELEGYEADDILGTLAASCTQAGDDCVIATGDKDSLQLIGEFVTVRLTATKMGQPESVFYDTAAFRERYGVDPIRLIDLKAIMGDSSDNIPGVKGIGEKGAMQLIAEYGSVENLYEHLDDADLKPAMRKKLEEGRDMAFLSKELATIFCEVPVPAACADYTRAPIDHAAAARLLSRLEMYKVMNRLGVRADAIPAAPVEEHRPVLAAVALVEPDAFLQALSAAPMEQPLYLLVQPGGDGPPDIAALCGDMAAFSLDVVFLKALLGGARPIFADNAKLLYRLGLQNGFPVPDIVFDIGLAGYLSNPNASEYTVTVLAAQHQVEARVYATDTPEEHAPLAAPLALMPALCDTMRAEITANGQEELLYEIELPLARVLASMEILGFCIDIPALTQFGEQISGDITRAQSAIYAHAGKEFNINSPAQLGEVLFEGLGLPAKKKTKTGYSTNVDVLEALRGKHPIIEDILEYRKLTKLKSTYVEGLQKVVGPDGRIHTSFNQTETRTGRISSTEPNMQNIPVRTELGSNLRRFFGAASGCLLVDADYSQIELRVLAHIANDANMTEAFLTGEDIHRQTAAQVFNMPPLFVTPLMRSRAKAVNFGIVYGISAFSLSQDIGVTVSEADQYIKDYLKTYSGVKRYMEETVAHAKEKGYVSTLWGRRRYLPELSSSNHNLRSFGERVAMNMPIQGTAADIIKIAMVRVYRRLERENLRAKLILQVHDELIVEAPEDEAERVRVLLCEEMEGAAALRVPLTADAKTGRTWYEAH